MRQSLEEELLELKSIRERQLLSEGRYRELSDRWGNVFRAGMGAEAVHEIVSRMDLAKMAKQLRQEIKTTRSKQRRKKAAKQLRKQREVQERIDSAGPGSG